MTTARTRLWLGFTGVLTSVATLLLTGCAGTSDVTRDSAHEMVQHGAKLIDVRTADEYAEKHPDPAINIPLDEIRNRLSEIGPKDTPVIVYCHTGIRAALAADRLRKAGYRRVYNLGTMDRWWVDAKGQPSKFD
jgi:phage shock protein E